MSEKILNIPKLIAEKSIRTDIHRRMVIDKLPEYGANSLDSLTKMGFDKNKAIWLILAATVAGANYEYMVMSQSDVLLFNEIRARVAANYEKLKAKSKSEQLLSGIMDNTCF